MGKLTRLLRNNMPVRATLAGMLCYLLLPLYSIPQWQWQQSITSEIQPTTTAVSSEQSAQRTDLASAALAKIAAFHQQYGDAGWPALRAQLALNRLSAYEAELRARQQDFHNQLRDDRWAEATEYIIRHVSQSDQALALQSCECRNNLCALEFAAPAGLTPTLQRQVLQLASALKTAGLEYHQVKLQATTLRLELRSDKALVFYFWQRWQLEPAAKAQWQGDIREWLARVAIQPPEPAAAQSATGPTGQRATKSGEKQ